MPLKYKIKFFVKRVRGLFCKHEIQICGGGSGGDAGTYTSWMCTKCYLNMRETNINRNVTCQ